MGMGHLYLILSLSSDCKLHGFIINDLVGFLHVSVLSRL